MEGTYVQILDKTFVQSISACQISEAVQRMARQICEDLRHEDPVFLVVLNGAFMFASDLMKQLDFPSTLTFVKFASYQGTSSSGKVKELIGLAEEIKGRTVVILEDIIDTGLTMQQMLQNLYPQKPKEIRIASLFLKPEKLEVPLDVHYVAFRIPNDFIVGYGLDYEGYGRNLPAIYSVSESDSIEK